jgi:type IV pilus assembly protein PilA
MKNNKGVTLVELLIVIVVMGIIAAFAVPAVGQIIENQQKSAVYADALAIEQAVELICTDTICVDGDTFDQAALSDYVKNITWADYDTTGNIATYYDAGVQVVLEAAGSTGALEFVGGLVPSDVDRDSVSQDATS